MTITKIISYFITVSMAGVIIWAQGEVSIFDSPIPGMPWGVVSLVDLYSGFILFSIWIFYKERVLPAVIWTFFCYDDGKFYYRFICNLQYQKFRWKYSKIFYG